MKILLEPITPKSRKFTFVFKNDLSVDQLNLQHRWFKIKGLVKIVSPSPLSAPQTFCPRTDCTSKAEQPVNSPFCFLSMINNKNKPQLTPDSSFNIFSS